MAFIKSLYFRNNKLHSYPILKIPLFHMTVWVLGKFTFHFCESKCTRRARGFRFLLAQINTNQGCLMF